MTTVLFTREIQNAIINIAYQLEKANELKEKELKLKEKYYDRRYGISI